MIVRRFLAWIKTAPAAARASATAALARAYLFSGLPDDEREEAMVALTLQLDDPSPLVRRALAETFANAAEAPQHLVMALAADLSDIAAVVLSRSVLIDDAALIDFAATGDALIQTAIAMRPELSAPVAAALAEVAEADALVALASNAGARLPEFSMARIVERFGENGAIREALLSRVDLPVAVRQSIVVAVSAALSSLARERSWMPDPRCEQVTREAAERATVQLAARTPQEDLPDLIDHLRKTGQLTPAMLLRAVLVGEVRLFLQALASLSGLPGARVAALASEPQGGGFAALYRKAGLPDSLFQAFRTGLSACLDIARTGIPDQACLLAKAITGAVIASCGATDDRLGLMVRRLHAEAVRDAARLAAAGLLEGLDNGLTLMGPAAAAALPAPDDEAVLDLGETVAVVAPDQDNAIDSAVAAALDPVDLETVADPAGEGPPKKRRRIFGAVLPPLGLGRLSPRAA